MSRDRFQRASAVFLAARQQSGAAREAILSERCAGDAGLRADVERLLSGDEASSGIGAMDSGLIGAALRHAAAGALREHENHSAPAVADPNIGRRIGRSLVLERIGAGGMGAVYRAQQDNPCRIVALKIIRPGLLSTSMLRRFQHETHVLGRLQHPGIAQIFEAGMDDAGDGAQPYFVMEYVDGPPLHVYARQRQLAQRERLNLLASVADAVEHAHQRGVIHRDLKPGNILVAEGVEAPTHHGASERNASMPRPKILDFGVARAIDSDVNVTTLHTSPGQIVGTVTYMSPEQAAGNPDDIDTRSDVYALGVIGYELLAGRPPHDLGKRTVPDALRTIAETDPTMLGSVDRACRGDIETIIARALEKDRARRYQSAAEFAADIRRFLRDEPILARPPSTIYQLKKFARRNKALVGGLAAVFVVLVAGIIGTGLGLSRALGEARKAQRMNEYLRGMIAFLDPSVTKNNQVTLRDVLDDASRRVDTELGADPAVAAEILVTIARGYSNLAEYDLAAEHGRRAIAMLQRADAGDEATFAAVWELIGLAHFRGNRPAEAEEAYRTALALNRRNFGDAHPDTLGNIRDIIHLLEIQDQSAEVDDFVTIAVNGATRLPADGDDEQTGLALEAIGDILGTQHRLDEAERMYLRAIDVLGRVQGSPYAAEQCIVTIRNLAFIYEMQQRLDEAERLDRRAVELSEKAYGREHDVTLVSLNGLGRILRDTGQLEESEQVFRDAVAITRKLYGDDSLELAHDAHNLATVLRERDNYAEAIELFSEALAVRRSQLPAGDADTGRTLQGLGLSLLETGRGPQAVPLLREALDIRIQVMGAGHLSVALVQCGLGAAVASTGAYQEAESLLLPAWEKLGRGAAPSLRPREREGIRRWLFQLYQAWGKPERAAEFSPPHAESVPGPATQPASTSE